MIAVVGLFRVAVYCSHVYRVEIDPSQNYPAVSNTDVESL